MQEPLAQIQDVVQTVAAVYQKPIEDIEKLFLASPVARINWASHVILLNSSLPLGVDYWYMKQSVEMGWSSNVLKMQPTTGMIPFPHERKTLQTGQGQMESRDTETAGY